MAKKSCQIPADPFAEIFDPLARHSGKFPRDAGI